MRGTAAPTAPGGPLAGGVPALGADVPLEMTARRLGPLRRFLRRRPRVMDGVVVVVFALGVVPVPAMLDTTRILLVCVIGLLGCAALVVRRSRPLLTAGAMLPLAVAVVPVTGHLQGFELGLAMAVYAVTVARPPRTAWLTFAALVVVPTAAVWLLGSPDAVDAAVTVEGEVINPDQRIPSTIGLVIAALAAMAIATSVRNRRQHLAELMARADALALDRDRQAQLARAAERSRLAREMHDVVAHSVSVMIALADGANAALDRSPERARTALTELSGTGRAALADLRRVLGVLAEDDGVATAPTDDSDLGRLVEPFRTAGLPVRIHGLGTPLPADTTVRMGLRRILSESLTNVLRHAPGSARVDVSLERLPDRVVLVVEDSGATVPVADAGGAGQGLEGMKERAALQGGSVTAGPHGTGWRVRAELPWEEKP